MSARTSTPLRLVGFVTGLALVFTLALGVGRAVGPIGSGDSPGLPEPRPTPSGEHHEEGHSHGR